MVCAQLSDAVRAFPACTGNILPDKGKYPTKPRNTFTMSSLTWGGSNILLDGDPQAGNPAILVLTR